MHTNPIIAPVVTKTANQILSPEDKDRLKHEGLSSLNDQEIILYGQALDQFNLPVAGAEVDGVIQVNNGVREGTDRLKLLTDADGRFNISGHNGKNLGITIKRIGYILATTNTSFNYSLLWPQSQRHVPDSKHPVEFRMWKLQGAESLLNIHQRFRIPFGHAPIYFDLMAGELVPSGGDLKAEINRPDGVISERHPQNWSVDLEAVGGGFQAVSEAAARVTFTAPEDGYSERGRFANNNGPELVDQMIYVKSRGGQVYSKILLFSINREPNEMMLIEFSGIANTNGSRNWESDAKR